MQPRRERVWSAFSSASWAPTEEEFTVARRRSIPILAFRKLGVEPEPEQKDFSDVATSTAAAAKATRRGRKSQ